MSWRWLPGLVLLPALMAQEPLTAARLGELQDRGELTVGVAVAALRGAGDLGCAAAAIVRHEWVEVPAELLDAIVADVEATALLLRELALAPRPSLADWVDRQLERDVLPADVRCLALAAAARPLSGRDADLLVLAAVDADGGDDYRTAAWLLEPKSADRLIGRLHAAMLEPSTDVSRLLPFFDRLSPAGYEQLIGLLVSLPEATRGTLARYFLQRDVPAFQKRAAAALDGKIELEPIWLQQAEDLLGERARVERLFGVLADPGASAELQEAVFRALVAAEIFAPPVLRWIEGAPDRSDHIRRVLDAGVANLPVAQLVAWLRDDGQVAAKTATALLHRQPLEPEIVAALRDLLADVVVQGPAQPLAMALLHGGSADAVAELWPSLRRSPLFPTFVDALARRRAPWGHELLLAELADAEALELTDDRREQLDAVRLALVTLGDRRQLDALVARAKASSPAFVRRCLRHGVLLDAESSLRLLADAAALTDDDLAVELIAWAAVCPDPRVQRELMALWQSKELSERQLAALHGLAAGAARPELVSVLRQALASGPLDERSEALAYELIATMATPLARPDLELLGELALVAPLSEPERERARAERWRDGRAGFPMVAAVANRLRGADPVLAEAVFAATAAQVRTHVEFAALAPQRLLVLWRTLEPDPALQSAVGRATADLLFALPDSGDVGRGPAHLFAMDRAERAADFAVAAHHARAAVGQLLRHPVDHPAARMYLGERDPGVGQDPWSRLAARVYELLARQALVAGDRAGAEQAIAAARELAGRDTTARQRVDELSRESK